MAEPEDLEEVKCDLDRFWDLDTLGICPDREISPVLEDFLHTVSHNPDTKRYKVSLPRKSNISNLPSNFSGSLGSSPSSNAQEMRTSHVSIKQ